MSTSSRKRVRLIALTTSMVVLALALLVPGAVGAQAVDNLERGGFDLEIGRDCSTIALLGDPATQCSFNVAEPEAKQYAPQKAYVKNDIWAEQEIEQKQENKAIVVPISANLNFQKDLTAVAKTEAKSGDAKAYGHWQDVKVFAKQDADASAKGFIVQVAKTGDANANAQGDNDASGGNANAEQESKSVIAGEAELEIEGDIGVVEGGDADAEGRAGDGGDIEDNDVETGDGGSNLGIAASLGGLAIGGDGGAGVENDTIVPGGAGGAATGGAAGTAGNTQTAGSSGSASLNGTAGDGGSVKAKAKTENWGDTTVNALAKGVGDNAWSTANGTATGGSADGGKAGHFVVGGKTGDAYNEAAIVGGQAANVLHVDAKQSGDVYAHSGSATNSGTPSATVHAPVDQKSEAKADKVDQKNEAKGANVVSAKAESEQKGPIQSVKTDDQTASGTAKSNGGIPRNGPPAQ